MSALAIIASLVLLLVAASAEAAEVDPGAQRLADRHAPVLMLQAQDEQCDTDGEPYEPTSVEIVLDNPQVFLRQVGSANPVLANAPGAGDIAGLGEGFFLDFPGDALSPGCIYEKDFRRYADGRRSVVYAHVATQEGEPDRLALQYWFYWYYNDWNNKHESDWEGIQLLFDVGSVEEALQTDPVSVGFAQHEGGERADWDSDKLERRGTRPVVYPSAGSHASYFSSALYLGRSGSEGFGCDYTGGTVREVDPEAVVLPDEVTDPDDPLAWLAFEGRWGERQSGPFNGPTGPAQKGRWTEPVDWHDELRRSSVIVPGGDDSGTAIITTFCGLVEWGSAQLITLEQNPEFVLIAVVILAFLLSFAYRRTDWSAVHALPITRRRRAGQIVGSAARLYASRPLHFAAVGLIYLPVALLVGAIVAAFSRLPLLGPLLESDDGVGAVGSFFALSLGGVGHVVAMVVTVAVVATLMRTLESGGEPDVQSAWEEVSPRIGGLVSALLRAAIIVGALVISVIGIPWGIRQTVRYQFLSQAGTLEGLGGRAALDRSSELVRGRWWHTALVIIFFNALVAAAALVTSLLLLVFLTGIPLWLFTILVTLVSAAIAPYAAIATVLLYGDAFAEEKGLDEATPAGDSVTAGEQTAGATG